VTKFPVTKISAEIFGGAIAIRTGAAEKYRINLPESGAVFLKDDDESLNGAWVEKITYELARSMGIPAARCEFAEFPDGRKAIISFDYLRPNFLEQSGKMLLGQHFEQNKYLYTIETVLRTIDENEILLPKSFEVSEIATAADLLAGYLIFDYWVDNIDRHYENWGIQIDVVTGNKELLPTYDHGLSLGFLLFDEECFGFVSGESCAKSKLGFFWRSK
jgi:HipA-like C-terminal domain